MAGFYAQPIGAAFTADGTSAGVITVASTTGFYAGMIANISDSDTPRRSAVVKVMSIINGTTMSVQFVPRYDPSNQTSTYLGISDPPISGPNYGTSDISAYTAAHSSRIDADGQLVYSPNDAATLPSSAIH